MATPLNLPTAVAAWISQKPTVTLYHYTNASGLMGIITSGKLWATSAQYLNDSRELTHALDILMEVLNERDGHTPTQLSGRASALSVFLRRTMVRSQSRSEALVGVCSFSESADRLSQWRAYCPDGGVSLGFHPESLTRVAESNMFTLAKCIYDESQQRALIGAVVDQQLASVGAVRLAGESEDEMIRRNSDEILQNVMLIAPLMKDSAFAEEQEWRLMRESDVSSDWHFRTRDNLIIPYMEVSLEHGLDPFLLESVRVGPGKNQRLMKRSISLLAVRDSGIGMPLEPDDSSIPYRSL